MNKTFVSRKILKKAIYIICLVLICSPSISFAQNKLKLITKEPRNTWSLGFSYGENGFGPFASLYKPLGRRTDLTFNLSFSGVSDSREIERYDIFGNSVVVDKINRVFMVPLSIGIRKEMFKDDIEGNFTPFINFGVTPTLVLTNPYDKSFFSAIKYTTSHFALGGYGGIGVSFIQSKNLSMNVGFNYFYLPVIGNGVQSLNYSTINNVGGFQLAFGVNFLK